ncbi:MAG: extracellular solute-binding protein, partial [Candidatus Sericytochromatia bacterium]
MMRFVPAFQPRTRHMARLGVAIALALAASACAGGASQGDRATTVTIWLASDYAADPLFKDLNAEFEAAHPGVRVKLLGVPWEDIPTKVKTAIIGGKPPDIAHYHPFALGAQGFAEPLDDMWAEWGKQGDFLEGSLQDCAWNGRLYGVPLDINCTVLVYNRTLLKARGLAEPGPGYTFARWRDDLKALTDPAAQRHGVGLASGAWHTFAFIRANGGDVLTTDGGKVKATFTDP